MWVSPASVSVRPPTKPSSPGPGGLGAAWSAEGSLPADGQGAGGVVDGVMSGAVVVGEQGGDVLSVVAVAHRDRMAGVGVVAAGGGGRRGGVVGEFEAAGQVGGGGAGGDPEDPGALGVVDGLLDDGAVAAAYLGELGLGVPVQDLAGPARAGVRHATFPGRTGGGVRSSV